MRGKARGGKIQRPSYLPGREQWTRLLGFEDGGAVDEVLRRALLEPIEELTSLRGKRIRGQLVALSYRLLNGEMSLAVEVARRCGLAAQAIELIHAASLIVDDIEDGSMVRRGRPSLHLLYPMPIALNAANWLYFWPFDLFTEMALPSDQLLAIYEACHLTLLRAHFGQAVDLGAKIHTLAQKDVADVCLASMRLKTGGLMGFAAFLGGIIACASERQFSILEDFGRDLGVSLQMFDDLGNVIGSCDPAKRYEDLMLARPSWVWACAAQASDGYGYEAFLDGIAQLPDATAFERWCERHDIVRIARASARSYLDRTFTALEGRLEEANAVWSFRVFEELRQLGERISHAYE